MVERRTRARGRPRRTGRMPAAALLVVNLLTANLLVAALPAAVLLAAVTLAGPGPAQASTLRLEGEYQLMVDARKTDREYEWDYNYNNPETWTGAQFRLFTTPFPNTEAFVKFEADWNPGSNEADHPMFQYRESHLRYQWQGIGLKSDMYLFQRQDRFWVESHLIDVVRGGNLNVNGDAQGVRLDLEGWGDSKFTAIVSDFSGDFDPTLDVDPSRPTGTDDAYVFRLRRSFLDKNLRLGATYNRKVDAAPGDPAAYQAVLAADLRYSLGGTDIFLEFADSKSRRTPEHQEGSFDLEHFSLRRPDYWLPQDCNMRGEVRTLRLGNPTLGFYNVVPGFWFYGPDYVNRLGDGTRDEQGVYLSTWYLIPQRAITLTLNYNAWERRVYDDRRRRNLYSELYIEYVNGFTSKLSYSDAVETAVDNLGAETDSEFRDLFAEIQVESSLAWMRVQGKIKDIGTNRRKELASLESAVNLTSKLKVYGRYAFGNDPARLRKGLFTQLQYRPRGNMDVFLEYGPSWIGDSPNPVDDGDLSGGGDQKQLIKLIIKGTF